MTEFLRRFRYFQAASSLEGSQHHGPRCLSAAGPSQPTQRPRLSLRLPAVVGSCPADPKDPLGVPLGKNTQGLEKHVWCSFWDVQFNCGTLTGRHPGRWRRRGPWVHPARRLQELQRAEMPQLLGSHSQDFQINLFRCGKCAMSSFVYANSPTQHAMHVEVGLTYCSPKLGRIYQGTRIAI